MTRTVKYLTNWVNAWPVNSHSILVLMGNVCLKSKINSAKSISLEYVNHVQSDTSLTSSSYVLLSLPFAKPTTGTRESAPVAIQAMS